MSIASVIAQDLNLIPYRKELNKITGGVTATILLQQIIYWHHKSKGEFYKFIEPCKHEKYKHGDSWVEELGFSRKEFITACSKLVNAGLVSKKTDRSRLTRYRLNDALLEDLLSELYSSKGFTKMPKGGLPKAQKGFTKMPKRDLPLYTENTTETTTDINTCANRTKSDFINSEFERFWAEYPVKKGKAAASKTWKRKKLYEQTDFLINDVLNRVQFDSQWQNVKYIPHGSTYLNQETWQDEIQQSVNQPSNQQLSAVDRIRQSAMQQYPELFEQPSDGISMGANGRDIWPEVD